MRVVLEVTEGPGRGRSFTVENGDVLLVGRSPRCHLSVGRDTRCSRVHAIVVVHPPICRVRDLRSTHGTYVNENRESEAVLCDGDIIRVGRSALSVRIEQTEEGPQVPPASALEDEPEAEPDAEPAERPPASRDGSGGVAGEPARAASESAWEKGAGPFISDAADMEAALVSCVRCRQTMPPGEVGDTDEVEVCQACLQDMEAKGEQLPGYRLVEHVASDEVCQTWLGEETETGRQVTIQILDADIAENRRAVRALLREANAYLDAEHAGIVPLIAAGLYAKQLFLVMATYDGRSAETLREEQGGRLSAEQVVAIARQVLDALAYVHKHRMVHRDLRPGKLMIQGEFPDWSLLIAGFCLPLAAAVASKGPLGSSRAASSVLFMPPEAAVDPRSVDARADIFGLGATMYFLLTGEYCYEFGPESTDPLASVVEAQMVPIEQRDVELPPGLGDVIHRALRREPNERYQSAEEMRTALDRLDL